MMKTEFWLPPKIANTEFVYKINHLSLFDSIAEGYDTEFTHTLTGRMQRASVHTFLENCYEEMGGVRILEINCGTGEDAIWLTQKGATVTATDISEKMIETAKRKALNLTKKPNFRILDLKNIEKDDYEKYDLIFSNFGGLNCLSPNQLKKCITDLSDLLDARGKMVLVIMPRFCFWESLYFSAKLNFGNAFRRLSRKPISARLDDNTHIDTWYHSPSFFKEFKNLTVKSTKGVGILLPPSYLDNLFSKWPKLLNLFSRIEKKASKFSFFAYISDHYLIELEKSDE